MTEEEERRPAADPHEWKTFVESRIWADIEAFALLMIAQARNQVLMIDNPSSTDDMKEFYRLKSEASVWQRIAGLPEVMEAEARRDREAHKDEVKDVSGK